MLLLCFYRVVGRVMTVLHGSGRTILFQAVLKSNLRQALSGFGIPLERRLKDGIASKKCNLKLVDPQKLKPIPFK